MPFNPNEYRREYNKSRYEQITLRLLKGGAGQNTAGSNGSGKDPQSLYLWYPAICDWWTSARSEESEDRTPVNGVSAFLAEQAGRRGGISAPAVGGVKGSVNFLPKLNQ